MRTTSFNISDDLYRHVRAAAGIGGMTPSDYIRAAIVAALATHAANDPVVRMALDARTGASVETRERVSA